MAAPKPKSAAPKEKAARKTKPAPVQEPEPKTITPAQKPGDPFSFSFRSVGFNPYSIGPSTGARQFSCTIGYEGREFTTYFTLPLHSTEEPTLDAVMEKLAADAQIALKGDKAAWKKKHTSATDFDWNALRNRAEALRRFLGDKLFGVMTS